MGLSCPFKISATWGSWGKSADVGDQWSCELQIRWQGGDPTGTGKGGQSIYGGYFEDTMWGLDPLEDWVDSGGFRDMEKPLRFNSGA